MIKIRADYEKSFSAKAEKALELALDIRKFEISLYWQRTAYIWALIAAAFAGYFAVLAADQTDQSEFNAFVLACVGAIFSLAWFRVNRGSKFWQENWEGHVDLLEDQVCGPLYKTVLAGKPDRHFLVGGGPVSVSRVNQWVSVFVIIIWIILAVAQWPQLGTPPVQPDWRYWAVLFFTGVFGLVLAFGTRSKLGPNPDAPVINREAWLK